MEKFFIHTMGCKANQFEEIIIEENLTKHGLKKVSKINEADLYILNSCSVTHKSDNEAFYLLRNAKHKNPLIKTVLTGCVAQTEKDSLLQYDFIDYIAGNDEKLNLYDVISRTSYAVSDIMSKEKFSKVSIMDSGKTRASLKIQDGCDNRCSYCIIPFARGKSRSADIDFIINEIHNLEEHGFKEVVLTGIHIGLWGKDLGLSLLDLLKVIEKRTKIKRYRLGSLNPLEITDEMLDFLAVSDKFCPHFHLSLQSACDKTLRSMNRFYKVDEYLRLIDRINSKFNLPFLGSDIITGFAGETEEDFEVTRKNLEKSGLSQIHTFPYSIRKGTVGAEMPNQVDDREKERRANIIKSISQKKYKEFAGKNLGRVCEVLVEKHPDKFDGMLKGVTSNFLTVHLDTYDLTKTNTICSVELSQFKDGKIYGKKLFS